MKKKLAISLTILSIIVLTGFTHSKTNTRKSKVNQGPVWFYGSKDMKACPNQCFYAMDYSPGDTFEWYVTLYSRSGTGPIPTYLISTGNMTCWDLDQYDEIRVRVTPANGDPVYEYWDTALEPCDE